ncbi:hypothetical protein GGS21DRAFT_486505 [Xylaria nigripes]|nr:hypothetical protein GGS21DRAFT_486505 [Xylaria nigripes]
MKLSYLLSFFLASLTVASPVPTLEADVASLDVAEPVVGVIHAPAPAPAIEETPEYKAAIAAHPGLAKDKYYYFSLIWPNGPVGDGDKETPQELRDLQHELGFAHIGVVVGQITEKTTGKGKNMKTKRDFNAVLYHMTKQNVKPGDTEFKTNNFKASTKNTLKYGGETNKKKADGAKTVGKDYINAHKIYNVKGNNCNDFAQAVLKTLK